MKKIKNKIENYLHSPTTIIVIMFALMVVFFVISSASAQDLTENVSESMERAAEAVGWSAAVDLETLIFNIINVLMGLLGLIAIIFILYGGFVWMTSGGLPEKVGKAKRILKNAVIGLALIIFAYAIVVFIFYLLGLFGGAGGGVSASPGPPGLGVNLGALGSGIIQDYYPENGQRNVPRNVKISVTFKEPILISSIIDDDGTLKDTKNATGDNTSPVIISYGAGNVVPNSEIKGFASNRTPDNSAATIFTFVPTKNLGDGLNYIWYTVRLGNSILKADNTPAFGLSGYFSWRFEVGTMLDLKPPQVKSVFPENNSSEPKNVIIQIEFQDEGSNAMYPPGLVGEVTLVQQNGQNEGVGTIDLDSPPYIRIQADINNNGEFEDNEYVAGVFQISNGYKTVDFKTNMACGTNSCGDIVYCLPTREVGETDYRVIIGAATLKPCNGNDDCLDPNYNRCQDGVCSDNNGNKYPEANTPPDGVVDAAFNSLDGNKDGNAQGPPVPNNPENPDNYAWHFAIENRIESGAPEIIEIMPEVQQTGVELGLYPRAVFNRLLFGSSVVPGDNYKDGLCSCANDNDCSKDESCLIEVGVCKSKTGKQTYCKEDKNCKSGSKCLNHVHVLFFENNNNSWNFYQKGWLVRTDRAKGANGEDLKQSQVSIRHYEPFNEETDYGIELGSGIKDIYQNCFMPSAGPSENNNCGEDIDQPYCCNGQPQAVPCRQ